MKTGIIFGAWDLLHAGHVAALGSCKKRCDYLIVGLHVNPNKQRKSKNSPVQSMFERWVQLDGCKFVDQIIPYETEEDLINMLSVIQVDVRFVGEDYLGKEDTITGKDIVPITYIPRNHNYSSSSLRERLKS